MTTPRRDFKIKKAPKTASERELHRQQVQQLASRVRDEEHWQSILASAANDEQREELERVVGSMLTFRRAAVCTTPDCDSGLPGTWQPVLEVRSPLAVDEPSWVPIELKLCEKCKEDAQLANFLTDGIWSQILSAWDDPATPPVMRLTSLTWEQVH